MPRKTFPYDQQSVALARELRGNQTPAEKKLWFEFLCNLPHRFLRQRPIGPYIVDFYCAHFRLIIEVDGDSHYSDEAIAYDQTRAQFLQTLGLHILRFTNREVTQNLAGVCEVINRFMEESPQPPFQRGAKSS
jgi:very-short-patch-repair endonuclease